MQSIKINILGKQYPLKVNDGEVEEMHRIAEFVDEKFRLYRRELHKQPDSTIMVLAALSIAEEMFAARRKLNETRVDDEDVYMEVNEQIEEILNTIE